MKKKWIVAIVIGLLALLGVAAIVLRVQLWFVIQEVRETSFRTELGATMTEYPYYDVVGENLTMVEFEHFSVGIPEGFEGNDNEGKEVVSYKNGEEGEQAIGIRLAAYDASRLSIMDVPGLGKWEKKQLFDGCEQLGYGIPDSAYNSMKCSYSLREEDYDFWNYNKSLAYCYLLPYRLDMFVADGVNYHIYNYESEEKYILINERHDETMEEYRFYAEYFHPEDLNTSYVLVISVKEPELGYAIINSLQLH